MGTTEKTQGPSTPVSAPQEAKAASWGPRVSRARPTSANTALAGPRNHPSNRNIGVCWGPRRKRAGALLRSGRQFISGTQNFQNSSSEARESTSGRAN